MKCDELKRYKAYEFGGAYVYQINEVDAAIAELKEIIEKNRTAYYVDLGVVADDCEKLKAENERLNRELEHVKNGDCINTCDVVEKHVKEELKAKRALWLARAEKARYMAMIIDSFPYTQVLHFTSRKKDESGKPLGVARTAMEWWQMFQEVERKCRAKAEP